MKRYTYKFIPEVQKFVVFDGEEVKAMYKGRDKAFLECNRLNAAHDQGKKAANAEGREKENKKAEENNLPGVKVAPEQVKEIMQADAAYLVGKVTADNVKDFAANILAMIK